MLLTTIITAHAHFPPILILFLVELPHTKISMPMVRGLFPPNTRGLYLLSHTHHVQELDVQELSLATEDSQYGV